MEYPFKQILIFFIYVSLIIVCGFMAEKKGRHVFLGVLAGVFLPLVSLIFFSLLPVKKSLQKEKTKKIGVREKKLKELKDPCPYCKWSIKEGKDWCDECGKEFYAPEAAKEEKSLWVAPVDEILQAERDVQEYIPSIHKNEITVGKEILKIEQTELKPKYSEHALEVKKIKEWERKQEENKREPNLESPKRTTGTKEYNKISKGFLLSLWNLIPLIGVFIYLYKVVKTGIGVKAAKKAVWIAIVWVILANIMIGLSDPALRYVGLFFILGGIITLWIIAINYIGWKFFLGSFIIPIIIITGLASSMIVPRYIDLEANAKQRAIDAAISELNGRESLTWADQKISKSGWVNDANVLNAVNYDLGKDYTWSNGHPIGGGRDLNFKGTVANLKRTKSTQTDPARWSRE